MRGTKSMQQITQENSRSRYYAHKDTSPRHPRRKGLTSAKAIRRQQRIAAAMDFRLQGHTHRAIATQLHVSPETVRRYVLEGMAKHVPAETAQQVLKMELWRLDQMQSGIFGQAAHGDTVAIEAMLKIMQRRARYLGLDQDKSAGVSVSINGNGMPNAEDVGIQISFVRPSWKEEDGVVTIDAFAAEQYADGPPQIATPPRIATRGSNGK